MTEANTLRRLNWLWKWRHKHEEEVALKTDLLLLTGVTERQADDLPVEQHEHNVYLKQITAAAAPHAAYIYTTPQAVYDPASHRTYIAYLGLERDLYITFWDHQTDELASPVELANYPLTDSDNHGSPSIVVDQAGYIHIVWGSHNTALQYLISDSPFDISAFSAGTLGDSTESTYATIQVDPATGDLYIIDRTSGDPDHTIGAVFPSHEYGSLRKSTDGGSTWAAAVETVSTSGAGSYSDFYKTDTYVADDGYIHIVWTVAVGSGHDDVRTNIYHAKYDPAGSAWLTADGSGLGSAISWAEHTSCLVYTGSVMSPPTVSVAHDRILVTFSDDSNLYTSVFDGTSWTSADTTFNVGDDIQINPVVWPVPDGWRMLLPFDVDDAGELRLYGSLDVVGTTWSQIAVLQAATLGEGWSKASPVRGGGPMVAIVQQDPISYANTSATAVDLVGLFAVFDEWTQLTGGGGGQAGAATYTEAEVDALIADFSGELLMEDGATNPPVPIENEDQDDWLYEG